MERFLNYNNSKMPVELLAEIFLDSLSTDGSRPDITSGPLSLSQVCSSWRRVALSIPKLWDNLVLVASETPPRAPLPVVARQWFDRAGKHPLSITVILIHAIDEHAVKFKDLIKYIVTFAYRFRSISLTLGDEHVDLGTIAVQPYRDFELLTYLKINAAGCGRETFTAFQSAPILRKARLNLLPNGLGQISLPWAQLTHLDMLERCLPTYRFRSLLRVLPSLTHGAFFIEGFERILHTGGPPIVVPTLTHLTVSIFGGDTSMFLHHINVPSLQFVHIAGCIPDLPEIHSQHIIHQLPHVLEAVFSQLVVAPEEELDFITILENCTGLRGLTLDLQTDRTSIILESLEGDRLLMPDLERLTMYVPLDYDFSPDRYAEAIVSRWRTTALKSVELLFVNHREGMQEIGSLLEECIREGLKVMLSEAKAPFPALVTWDA